jgi:aspartate carbamoyltransferase catalytic subunit
VAPSGKQYGHPLPALRKINVDVSEISLLTVTKSVPQPIRNLLVLPVVTLVRGRFEQISTRSVKKAPPLRGKVVVNLFFEDSTRTRNSFALAANRLSADIIEFTKKTSSVSKGESLLDTARNLEAMGIDIVVIRHGAGGAPKFLSRNINACVVNAGEGFCEHPTQGLLDVYTIRKIKGTLEGLKISEFVGHLTEFGVRSSRGVKWA